MTIVTKLGVIRVENLQLVVLFLMPKLQCTGDSSVFGLNPGESTFMVPMSDDDELHDLQVDLLVIVFHFCERANRLPRLESVLEQITLR